jgi:hypothetical protein
MRSGSPKDREWNPRYLAYSAAQGRTPQAQMDHDRKAWPGGFMCGFLLWSRTCLGLYAKAHPEKMLHGTFTDHDHYDAWLADHAVAEALKLEAANG